MVTFQQVAEADNSIAIVIRYLVILPSASVFGRVGFLAKYLESVHKKLLFMEDVA